MQELPIAPRVPAPQSKRRPLNAATSQVIPSQQLKLRRSVVANTLVVATGIAILGFTGNFLFRHLTTVRSRDAVINGVIVSIRAPQQGMLVDIRGQVGDFIDAANSAVATLNNDYVSSVDTKHIETWLQRRRGELEAAQAKLRELKRLLTSAQTDSTNQKYLEVLESDRRVAAAKAELAAAKANLAEAQARYQLAKINYRRLSTLAWQGAVSQSQADAARTELEQSQAQVVNRRRAVDAAAHTAEALAANAQAARVGLTLRNTRSNYDPRLRLQELTLQIAEQTAIIRGIEAEIAAKEQELAQSKREVKQRQRITVVTPISGYIWHIDAQPGTFLRQGDSILRVLDCQRRWVDVFVDEQSLRLIRPGTKATIDLYGVEQPILRGTVTSIRSGARRLDVGSDTALPMPPHYPRQSKVRVEFDTDNHQGDGNFCYVGYTGKVTFEINPFSRGK